MNSVLQAILNQVGLAMQQPDFTKRQFHQATISKRKNPRVRMGITKHSHEESKVRRKMATKSRHINWRYQ